MDSASIRSKYTQAYYTQDCGGYAEFARTNGRQLLDLRLQSVALLCGLKQGGYAVDLGCGRGELTYYLGGMGFRVLAIDYSKAALELAEQVFEIDDPRRHSIRFENHDVCNFQPEAPIDVAVASDVIEHLSPPELDRLYNRVATNLAVDGVFIVHTAPNLWYYKYEYPRRRVSNPTLPRDPRSSYETAMHINEQSPRVLANQLSEHFRHVRVWAGDPHFPGRSLIHPNIASWRQSTDLYALASNTCIDEAAVLELITTNSRADVKAVHLSIESAPTSLRRASTYAIVACIENLSNVPLVSVGPNPYHISYRWIDSAGSEVIEGLRTRFWPRLLPGERQHFKVDVRAPDASGKYTLRVTIVQELVRWFDWEETNAAANLDVLVTS